MNAITPQCNAMTFAIHIRFDVPCPDEVWGPYDSEDQAREVIRDYVGVPESATVLPTEPDTRFTALPE